MVSSLVRTLPTTRMRSTIVWRPSTSTNVTPMAPVAGTVVEPRLDLRLAVSLVQVASQDGFAARDDRGRRKGLARRHRQRCPQCGLVERLHAFERDARDGCPSALGDPQANLQVTRHVRRERGRTHVDECLLDARRRKAAVLVQLRDRRDACRQHGRHEGIIRFDREALPEGRLGQRLRAADQHRSHAVHAAPRDREHDLEAGRRLPPRVGHTRTPVAPLLQPRGDAVARVLQQVLVHARLLAHGHEFAPCRLGQRIAFEGQRHQRATRDIHGEVDRASTPGPARAWCAPPLRSSPTRAAATCTASRSRPRHPGRTACRR